MAIAVTVDRAEGIEDVYLKGDSWFVDPNRGTLKITSGEDQLAAYKHWESVRTKGPDEVE